MNPAKVAHRIELRRGTAEPPELHLTPGQPLGPIHVGAEAKWRVRAEGVADKHAFLFFDGARLYLQSVDEQTPVEAGGSPIPTEWTAVDPPCSISLGRARLWFDVSATEEASADVDVPVDSDEEEPSGEEPPTAADVTRVVPQDDVLAAVARHKSANRMPAPGKPPPAAGRPPDPPPLGEAPESTRHWRRREDPEADSGTLSSPGAPGPASSQPSWDEPPPSAQTPPGFAPPPSISQPGGDVPTPSVQIPAGYTPPPSPPIPAGYAPPATGSHPGYSQPGYFDDPPLSAPNPPPYAPPPPSSTGGYGEPPSTGGYGEPPSAPNMPPYTPQSVGDQQPFAPPVEVGQMATGPGEAAEKKPSWWDRMSFPQRATMILFIPMALSCVVLFTDVAGKRAPRGSSSASRTSTSAPSASTGTGGEETDNGGEEPDDGGEPFAVPTAPVDPSAAPAKPDRPIASNKRKRRKRRGSKGRRTLQRKAVDAVAAASYEEAAKAYEKLAKKYPDNKAYAAAAAITRAKANGQAKQ